jgi:hypothetical protein
MVLFKREPHYKGKAVRKLHWYFELELLPMRVLEKVRTEQESYAAPPSLVTRTQKRYVRVSMD